MDCLFCKIASGEIPSEKLYEDEIAVAFKDINPTAPVHFLVIPKRHIESCAEINAENSSVAGHCFEVIARLAKELKLEKGFRVVSNTGEQAGQSVPHLHFHVLANREFGWPAG
ncbi:MAG: histidine triad nucleotide-binding protein [Oscillospiraceae bacterium]|nr:histidine triad nucleotide-binding protein [Oscillospiraceae bacterium]